MTKQARGRKTKTRPRVVKSGCPAAAGEGFWYRDATAPVEVRREGLRLVSSSRARHRKVRCITSHQSQPPLHNQWSRPVYLVCVPSCDTGTLLTPLATTYLCSAEAGKMGSAPPPAVSEPYVFRHVYVRACLHVYVLSAHRCL